MSDYQFRRVTLDDLPILAVWLAEPHVRQWWGDPKAGLDEIGAAMDDPACDLYMVDCGGHPIGYQQSWDPHAEASHPCRDQPRGTRRHRSVHRRGEVSVGRGHGTAFVRLFVEDLLRTGVPRVITDPNPRNLRAIRAYGKAGFVPVGNRTTISGDALLMSCEG